MTVKMAGLWEFGWSTPIKEIELWQFPLRDFEVDGFYMAPISGIVSRHVEERGSMEEIIAEARSEGLTIVFVDEEGATPLKEFAHPQNVLYVFGKAGSSSIALKEEQDLTVAIETPQSKGLLWPHQAATTILYDRYIK